MPEHRQIDTTGFRAAELTDQPQPTLIWVAIDELVIDGRYQRAITPRGRTMIQRIADSWDWRKSQPILVAGTDGGKYAVVDGQHRAHAAALCGIESLPAMLVPMSMAEQAAGFAAINRDRVSIDATQIYRAELAAGTPWAVQACDAVAAAGCHLLTAKPSWANRKPGQIGAIRLIRNMVEAGEAEAITAGLRAIRESESGRDADNVYGIGAYSNPVIAVWLPALASNQRFLRLPDLPAIFDRIDILTLYDDARAWTKVHGGSAKARVMDQVIDALTEERRAVA